MNVYGLAEPLNPHGIHWNVRPKRAPDTRSDSPGSPLYLIVVYTTRQPSLPTLKSSNICGVEAFDFRNNYLM